jgi:hypothetical protein
MSNEIKIVLTGDASGAVAAVKNVNTAVKQLPGNVKSATTSISGLQSAIGGVSSGVSTAKDSLLQLSSSFTDSGSTAGVLLSVLAGPAGIATALTGIVSIVAVSIAKYGSLSGAINALFGATNNMAAANRSLLASFAEAEGKAAAETATLNSLISIAKDKTLSDNARQEALDRVNKEYNKYLPKLTLEALETGKADEAVKKLNASLIRKAKIQGVQDLITAETKAQVEELLKVKDAIDQGSTASGKFINAIKGIGLSRPGAAALTGEIAGLGISIKESEGRVKFFTDALRKLLSEDAVDGTLIKDTPIKLRTIKDEAEKAKKELQLFASTVNDKSLVSLQPKIEKNQFTGAGLFGKQPKPQFLIDFDAQAALAEARLTTLKEKSTALADVLTGTLGGAFTGLFNDILSGSQSAFQAFGQAIKQVITKLIAAAVTAAIFAAIISVALGGSFVGGFKNVFSQLSGLNLKGLIPGFANGVTNFRGGMAWVGERGKELVRLPGGSDVIPNHMLNNGSQRQELFAFIDNRGIYLSNKRGGISAGRLG